MTKPRQRNAASAAIWNAFLAALAASSIGCQNRASAPSVPAVNPAAREFANAGKERPSSHSSVRFELATSPALQEFAYANDEESDQFSIVESLGGGVALLDYDGDARLDVLLPGGGRYSGPRELQGRANGLFRSTGAGGELVAVAEPAGIAHAAYYSHGAAVADADNDGFPDAIVTGYGGVRFYRNQGDGTFVEISADSGLIDPQWSSSAAWGDFNGDGSLDVYVVHYVNWSFDNNPICPGRLPHPRDVCPPRRFDGLPDALFLSDGAGGYRDASRDAGLRTDGKGLSVLASDLDSDGDLDVYVANDTVENFLLLNDGTGRFEDASVFSGAAYSEFGMPDGSMGVDLLDYDSDGLADLFVTNFEGENSALYRNVGQAVFRHLSQPTGVSAVGQMYVGWGVCAVDLDNDGDQDVAISNGHISRFPAEGTPAQFPILFLNTAGKFANVAAQAGEYFAEPHRGRGLAAGDLDGDGLVDLAAAHVNQPPAVLRNRSRVAHGFVRVRLVGTAGTRTAIGARVELQTGDRRQIRFVNGGGSYASTSDHTVHFGLGDSESASTLRIHWPSGAKQNFAISQRQTRWIVIEGIDRPFECPVETPARIRGE